MAKYIIDVPDKGKYRLGQTYLFANNGESIVASCDLTDLTPYTEPDQEAIENEVWEFIRKIDSMTSDEIQEAFTNEGNFVWPFNLENYKEAKDRYDKWVKKKDQIRVGDELKDDGNIRAVVLDIIDEDYVSYEVFTENGITDEWQKGIVVKTGRHFDEVEKLLEEMRNDS